MAAISVFAVTELLEGILLHLPLTDILKAKRVAKGWNQVMEQSILLRRATFLAPSGQSISVDLADTKRHATRAHDQTCFVGYPFLVREPFEALPLLIANQYSQRSDGAVVSAWWDYTVCFDDGFKIYEFEGASVCKQQGKPSNTLRNMFITQPQITALCLWAYIDEAASEPNKAVILRNDEGITVGLMQDILAQVTDQVCEGPVNQKCIWFFGFRMRLADQAK